MDKLKAPPFLLEDLMHKINAGRTDAGDVDASMEDRMVGRDVANQHLDALGAALRALTGDAETRADECEDEALRFAYRELADEFTSVAHWCSRAKLFTPGTTVPFRGKQGERLN